MSNTNQTKLMLGADIPMMRRWIWFLDWQVHYAIENGYDASELKKQMSDLRDAISQMKPTKFVNVSTDGVVFDKLSDNVLTDYSQTKFVGVKIDYDTLIDPDFYPTLMGENLDLNGAHYKLSNGEYFQISEAISSKEVAAESGSYVEAMLRNNVLQPIRDKKTTIAIASAINGDLPKISDRCVEVYGADEPFAPMNITSLQSIADLYNQEYATKYNVEFVLDGTGEPYDYRIGFCQLANQPFWGLESTYSFIHKDVHVAIGYEVDAARDPQTLLHELGHAIGSVHPYDTSIDSAKCSFYASTMCYDGTGIDIMTPLGSSPLPARLPLSTSNLGPQDHKAAGFVFGVNLNHKAQDISTNIVVGQNRLISGDAGYSNDAVLDTASLPEGVKYAVFDAAQAVGTCYEFPCDPKDLAKGVEGALLVLYKDSELGRPEILGSTLLFGGRSNSVIVDGETVFSQVNLLENPTGQPTKQPTAAPSRVPFGHPSGKPSSVPTHLPSLGEVITVSPSSQPSKASKEPSNQPVEAPSRLPSSLPSEYLDLASHSPSGKPTTFENPSNVPSYKPTEMPSFKPTCAPSNQPAAAPSAEPTEKDTSSNNKNTKDLTGFEKNIIYTAFAAGAFIGIIAAGFCQKRIQSQKICIDVSDDDFAPVSLAAKDSYQLVGMSNEQEREI